MSLGTKTFAGVWHVAKTWHGDTTNSEFLQGDCRRQMRQYLLFAIAFVHVYKTSTTTAENLSAFEYFVHLFNTGGFVATAVLAMGRPASLWVDVMSTTVFYAVAREVNGTLHKSEDLTETVKVGNCCVFFCCAFQMLVAMGTHYFLVVCWFVAVWNTTWLTGDKNVQETMLVMATILCTLNGMIQFSQVQKYRQQQEAQAAQVRLDKLEQDRARQRQERVELCLAAVLKHLKAPLMLLRSEISVLGGRPDAAPAVVAALCERVGQLWSTLSGLEADVQKALPGVDLDVASLQSFGGIGNVAKLPQNTLLEVAQSVPLADSGLRARHRSASEAGSQCQERSSIGGKEVCGKEDTIGPRMPIGEEGPSLLEPSAQQRAAADFGQPGLARSRRSRRAPSTSGSLSSCGGPLGPHSLRVVFDPLHPRLGIQELNFVFDDECCNGSPGLVDLLPQRQDLPAWVQRQINAALHDAADDNDALVVGTSGEVLGRVNVDVSALCRLLKPLLVRPQGHCRATLAFEGLEDNEEGCPAVVVFTTFSKPNLRGSTQ